MSLHPAPNDWVAMHWFRDACRLDAENRVLRGLLREVRARFPAGFHDAELMDRISAALAGEPATEPAKTDQPSAATENPEAMYNPVARGGHAGASARQIDVAAGDQLAAGQPERCCLDYPRCDCNSPPEPDNAPALQPCGHPWKAQHDSKCILCSSPGVTP